MPEQSPGPPYWFEFPLALLVLATFVSAVAFYCWRDARMHRTLIQEKIRQRPGQNKGTFVAFFQDRQIPCLIVDTTYGYFQGFMGGDFPVLPQDKIADLSFDFDFFELRELARKCGGKLASQLNYEYTFQLDTVENLVLFLAACPPVASASGSNHSSAL